MDEVFGQMAARLHFEQVDGEDGAVARLGVGYSCSQTAGVTTVRLLRGAATAGTGGN